MNENVLKREFQRKDVERLRNLMTKKSNNPTVIGIGYEKKKKSIKKEIYGRKMDVHGL